jgi:carboxyl-terminal processing protease
MLQRSFFILVFNLILSLTAQALELSCNHVEPIQMKYLSRHVNYSKADAKLQERVIEQYIKALDPTKLYLTEWDVAKIKKLLSNVFKDIRETKCEPIHESYALLLSRVKESVEFAKVYLGADFKFNPNTKILINSDKRKYAKSKKELQEFQQKYMQLQVANYVATGVKVEEAKSKVSKNYERSIKRLKDEDAAARLSLYIDSFARSLDPHSTYWSADAYQDFEINIQLSLEGIGATLSSKDGFTVIEQLIPGGSAARSGLLRPKDMITAVGEGETGPFEDVLDQDLRDVVKKIRGKKGTKVRLSILRKEGAENTKLQVTLIRDKISLEDEAAQVYYIDRKIGEKQSKVALINLPSFYADPRGMARGEGRSAASDVRKLLREARAHNADSVVLDLSSNGGGSLEDAVKIAGLFFREGNVVKQSSKDASRGEIALADDDPMVHFSGPLVVLISRGSASASEIVAGTLKDYRRAIVVGGDHTYGKGTVQAVENLPEGLGAIKTTIGMFFTAGGKSTQHVGVNSDIELPSVLSTDEIGEKTLDYSLPPKVIAPFLSAEAFVASGPAVWKVVDQKTIQQLRTKSRERVKKDAEFKKIEADIAKNKQKKNEILISDLLKDREKEEKDDKKDAVKSYDEIKKERLDKYLKRADIQEAVNIAADLWLLQNGGNPELMQNPIADAAPQSVEKSSKAN